MTNPPADAVGLSGGPLLAFGLVMLRQLIVMYLISLGAIVIGGIGGTMATAVYLAMFMTAFSPMAEFLLRCGRHAETCTQLPVDFPIAPDDGDITATYVRPVCATSSAIQANEILSMWSGSA